MKAKTFRLIALALVCAAALWRPATALAYEICPSQQCSFWRNVCENNTGHFTQTQIGYCEPETGGITVLWNGHCEYTWRGPWDITCVGI